MKKIDKTKLIIILSVVTSFGVLIGGVSKYFELRGLAQEAEKIKVVNAIVKERIGQSFTHSQDFPQEIYFDNEKYEVKYTFNDKLSTYVEKLLKRYKTDYSTIIVIDNESGEILSAVGYDKVSGKNDSLPYSSTHPSASLFKIITAADLLENTKIEEDSLFQYRGKGTTLYKYQLENKNPKSKWVRTQTLKGAFAFSNNVIFGKAAINYLDDNSLIKMASSFGFNTPLIDEIPNVRSVTILPNNSYQLAEMASGFNKQTLISPLHGAVLSSVVANDGVLVRPKLVSKVVDVNSKKNIWKTKDLKRILLPETSAKLKEMMVSTVKKGTARGAFRRLKKKLSNELIIGGKTGSITGGVPYGKRDWFTAFAIPANGKDSGISVCVMNINQKKWYIRSTELAKSVIEYYYNNIEPIKQYVSNKQTANL